MTRIEEIREANKGYLERLSEDYCPDCAFLLELVDEAFALLSGDEPYELSSVTPWLAKYRSADPAGAACAIELPHRAHEFRGVWCDGQGVSHNGADD